MEPENSLEEKPVKEEKVESPLPAVEVVESTGFDKSLYDGFKTPIQKVTPEYVQDTFPDGLTYTPDSKQKKWVLRITTEPLPVLKKDSQGNVTKSEDLVGFTDEDDEVSHLEISLELNFQNKKDENGQVVMKEYEYVDEEGNTQKENRPVFVISKASKAALWKFMRKMGVEDYRELKGKVCTLTVNPSNKAGDDRTFINIVTG